MSDQGAKIHATASGEPASAASPDAANALVALLEHQVTALQSELDDLRTELTILRQRDETIRYHMDRLNEEMRLAARLQRDFLPKTLPQLGSVRFHAVFRPASYVSGDLYDVIRLDENHLGFYMADAVGHGVPAALLTMYVKRALVTKEILADGYRLLAPRETVGRINDAIIEQDLSQVSFATVLYGTINTQSLELSFARGGHPLPLLIRPGEPLRFLECEGPLLGILPSDNYFDHTLQLRAGDRLLIYTDGVELAYGSSDEGDMERWIQEVEKRRHLGTQQLLDELCASFDNAAGSIAPEDDLTALVLEVTDGSPQD